ncbi:hypothetical protein CCO02nite_21280 [Cellulomonas composti]|uniref:Uncharacterized protein n=1 Tax=Cellulomonas composti TaxID=266130 RepID=A0A511JBV3_9CELL|nr:hypothetical protein CCO02nite_21280 [Cellulomonas composti]
MLDEQAEARLRRDDPRLLRADRELERRTARVGPVDPEHLARDAELEGGGIRQQDGRDATQHAPSLPESWQKFNGYRQFCH